MEGLRRAFGEGFDAALGFVLWFIRFVLVLIPFVILVVLPMVLLWRWLRGKRQAAARVSQEATRDPGKGAQS
jgi:membrane protein implicated in regulation of membrane protease activity